MDLMRWLREKKSRAWMMMPRAGGSDQEQRLYQERLVAAKNRWPKSMFQTQHRAERENSPSLLESASTILERIPSRFEVLGSAGGRSATFYALDHTGGDRVLLKVVQPLPRGGSFTEAMEVLRRCRTRHQVGVRECIYVEGNAAVLVTDCIDGESLKEMMDSSEAPNPEASVHGWMIQIGEAMACLESSHVVHRNLKPSNIVIDPTNAAHPSDFAMAALAGSEVSLCGTPVYAAPEQLTLSRPVDSRSDIYGFGATFYHAATGQAPFDGRDVNQLIRNKLCGKSPVPPCETNAQVSLGLSQLIMRCISISMDDRFQSFTEVLASLDPQRTVSAVGCQPIPPTLVHPTPRLRISGFEIEQELGRGGMGIVYKAIDCRDNRPVAIKVIRTLGRTELDQIARFRIEAEAVACLRHRNIVPVIQMGVSSGDPYVVLEYVSGGNLADRIGGVAQDPLWSARVAEGISRGLHHSHSCAILHRDLKPQNVLLTDRDVPRITDFGLAKITVTGKARERLRDASIMPHITGSLMELHRFQLEPGAPRNVVQRAGIDEAVDLAWQHASKAIKETISMDDVREFLADTVDQQIELMSSEEPIPYYAPTRDGDILGTPAYMAPEQTYGDTTRVGCHTDVYALGAILYESLLGRPPHHANNISELFMKIREAAPDPLDDRVPSPLRQICMKCLEKKPEARYADAASVAKELNEFLLSEQADQTSHGRDLDE